MRDVLIREPAHETVKVSRQALVALGCEASLTTRATISDRPELYHLPADRSRRDDEVEGALAPGLHSLRSPLRVERNDAIALAERAAGCRDFHSVCHPQIAVLPASALRLAASSRPRWYRSSKYMASLIVEIGPLIDELEIGMRILRPGHGTRQLIELSYGRDARRHCIRFSLGLAVRLLAQKSTDSAQRVAVLEIVLDQPSFPRSVAGLLPVLAPDDAFDARSVRLGPAEAKAARHLLEAVRVSGKIEMRVDDREHVRERG